MAVEDYNDIESYRRMRRKKRRRRRLITFAVILLLIACLILTFTHFLNIDLFEDAPVQGSELASATKPEHEGFPLSLEGEKAVDIRSMGGLITLLTDTKVAFYTDTGKWVGSDTHGYANPVLKTTARRALVYDRSGNKLRVLSKDKVLAEKTLPEKILFAEISENGYVAVSTQENRYAGALTIYDQTLSEVYKWYSSSNQLVDMAFYSGSSGCVALGYTAENGGIVSTVVSLNFSKEKVQFETKLPDMLGVSVSVKHGGNIAVVGDVKTVALDKNGKEVGSYTYDKQLSFVASEQSRYTALALTDPNSRANSEAVVLDNNAKFVGSYTVEKRIKDVVSDGSRILLLGSDKIYTLDMRLNPIGQIPCKTDSSRIAFVGSYIYITSSEDIVKTPLE